MKEGGAEDEKSKDLELPDLQFSDDDDVADIFATAEVRKQKAMKKRLRRLYNKFTSKLRIPCYKKLQYFYYYDVLEAFARVLFQNDLDANIISKAS